MDISRPVHIRIGNLFRPGRTVAHVGSVARLRDREWRTGPGGVNTIRLPVAEREVERARRLAHPALSATQRKIIDPAQSETLPEVLRAQALLLMKITAVLNRCTLAHK